MNVCAAILAGGRGSRMHGADKGLLQLNDRPLIAHVIERLQHQTAPLISKIVINANRNQQEYSSFGFDVISDLESGDYLGPLAGFECVLDFCKKEENPFTHVLFVPCDSPIFPTDLLHRLAVALEQSGASLAVVSAPDFGDNNSDRKNHLNPVFTLMRCDLLGSLQSYLKNGGRKIETWMRSVSMEVVAFDQAGDDAKAFFNTNTPEQLTLLKSNA